MDDEEKVFSETPNDPYSLKLVEYLIGRIAALERRIELLEGKTASSAEDGDALLKELVSRSDALDKKLDILIGRTVSISEAGGIEDIGSLVDDQKENKAEAIAELVNVISQAAAQNSAQSKPQAKSAAKKKQVAVFIDGENISHKKAKKIIEYAGTLGSIDFSRVYGVQNNPSDKCWVKASNALSIKHIRLAGGSKKNKVDKKMFEEILCEAGKKDHADIIVVATNDGDFAPTVKAVKDMGIHIVVIGLKKAMSTKMKEACNSLIFL